MCSPVAVARTGRHRQRYDNHFRLVAGCIPYRLKEQAGGAKGKGYLDVESRVQVLMLSTPNRYDLVFPKGGWEDDETEEEAACRETLEEAGVRGIIRGALGEWEFRSKSRQKSQNCCSPEGSCRGSMFALEVTDELPSWPEQETHRRRWVTVNEAMELCRYDWMREALIKFLRLLSGQQAALHEVSDSSSPLFASTPRACSRRDDSSERLAALRVDSSG